MQQPAAQHVPDQWDRKAERIHGRHDAVDSVPVVRLRLSFGDVFKLVLFAIIAQSIIGGVILVALLALNVI